MYGKGKSEKKRRELGYPGGCQGVGVEAGGRVYANKEVQRKLINPRKCEGKRRLKLTNLNPPHSK